MFRINRMSFPLMFLRIIGVCLLCVCLVIIVCICFIVRIIMIIIIVRHRVMLVVFAVCVS